MIVAEDGDELRLVTQCDHAHLAAELLRLWRPLAGVDGRDVLLRATRRHDDGWQGVDAAPPVDAAGRPHDFTTLPWVTRLEIWDRGTAAYEDEPGVALLIVEHALALHRDRSDPSDPEDPAGRLVAMAETRRAALVERLGERAEVISALYPWLRAADLLSLAVTGRWLDRELGCPLPDRERPLRAKLVAETLLLDPFPYAGTTSFHYPERRIRRRSYRDALDLGVELASSRWKSGRVTLRSWGSSG